MSERPRAALAWILPFLAYVGLMGAEHALGVPVEIGYAARLAIVALVLVIFSRPLLRVRPSRPLTSVLIGFAVFVIWVGPDVVFGPGYRQLPLFNNAIVGRGGAPLSEALRQSFWFLFLRAAGSVIIVPIVEELFWRGWLMRWIINTDFQKVPLGEYAASAFWIVAVLFASEHGPYWEVGLAAGIVYNWWLIRTRNLADCMLAHAVTNGVLAAWVVGRGQWQYWI